jgi:hypothetical protein
MLNNKIEKKNQMKCLKKKLKLTSQTRDSGHQTKIISWKEN